MAETFGRTADFEAAEFANSRAEAKKAHQERMSHLRQVDVRERENIIAAQQQAIAEAKPSAFQIAVSVANAADSKVCPVPAYRRYRLFLSTCGHFIGCKGICC
jgi:hypothetical protein